VYEPTGEPSTIYDAQAVASSSFADPEHMLRFTYDTRGRTVKIEDPDLSGGGHTSSEYGDSGMVVSTTNARSEQTTFSYDAIARLIAIDSPPGEDDYAVEYRATESQRWKDSSSHYQRVYDYDAWGRLERSELSVVVEAGAFVGSWNGTYLTDYEYDLAGRMTRLVAPDSTDLRYEYEGAFLDRVCELTPGSIDCDDVDAVRYVDSVTYDDLGRRTHTVTGVGTRLFEYEGARSRLTRDRFDAPGPGYGFEQTFESFHGIGNLEVVRGNSSTGDVTIDADFSYDLRERLSSWTKDGIPHTYAYDDLGNMTVHGGEIQTFTHTDRPHAVTTARAGAVSYAYDDDGNVMLPRSS
jgi:YD repeat-containing protein